MGGGGSDQFSTPAGNAKTNAGNVFNQYATDGVMKKRR